VPANSHLCNVSKLWPTFCFDATAKAAARSLAFMSYDKMFAALREVC